MAEARFWICERSFWQVTTMPVGQVGDPYRGVGGVDALAAGAGRAVDVDPDVVVGDVDVVGLLDDRRDVDAGERGLPPRLVVERADAHEAVDAVLAEQRPVRVRHLDLEGDRLDAGLLGVGRVVDLERVVVPLGPAAVHAQQHLGPVGRVDAAGLAVDGDERLAGVVLAGEQGADLEAGDVAG